MVVASLFLEVALALLGGGWGWQNGHEMLSFG